MFHYTIELEKELNETILLLNENLKKEGFGVLWEFSVTEKLQEKGFNFPIPFVILEVCNPEEASRVLNENLLVGYFLPCKIVVFKDKGKTKIGMPKPTVLIQALQDERLVNLAHDIEKRLISCIEECKLSK